MIKLWFLNLTKEKKVYLIIAVIVLAIILFFGIKASYYEYKYLKEKALQVDALQNDKEDLLLLVDQWQLDYNVLEKQKQKTLIEYIEIETKLKTKEDETNNVPSAVMLYADIKLDSTIRSYKHIQRPKN
ncbi:hypothetical protein ES692_06095 [Psychroserpens burtonensis]|uniref:Uncharacterized protein n=1 Tax=Psychroserpens burtonensis TaxID=49278 RepID=A0A5C7BI19_9FLAO|nr:hypothetical protein [Psychroserpens burtonensis]TXE18612.1 hypothetical protein ES692_06095 [Psychroserpens burtonensis]